MISTASDSFNNSHNLLLVDKTLFAKTSYPHPSSDPNFNPLTASSLQPLNTVADVADLGNSNGTSHSLSSSTTTTTTTTTNQRTLCSQCLDEFFTKVESIYENDGIDFVPRDRMVPMTDRQKIANNQNDETTMTGDSNGGASSKVPRPKISINVIDTENLSVCMCSLYNSRNNSDDNLLRQRDDDRSMMTDETNKICPICRNIIKKQPIERRTLISKRLLLANDIIVNRIDSHFLNTFSGINFKQDPYTPESPDSFSPVLESESSSSNRDESDRITSDDIEMSSPLNEEGDGASGGGGSHRGAANHSGANNNNVTGSGRPSGGVSPRQLKSRLERLRRMSESSDDETTPITNQKVCDDLKNGGNLEDKNNSDCCTTRCCIL